MWGLGCRSVVERFSSPRFDPSTENNIENVNGESRTETAHLGG